eukprot:TRINITY_DN20463_c0_g2_i2.p3 TRINITY_DN20463_c0_g2~~TRINITY_DN20463_c0_g2_i2.p3  ORF type:complete len:199 (-),score=29.35 TRINITY_DN20463_c0_g2_i2:312-908(-)
MSYFGCGTRSNKIGWILFSAFAVLGVIFMAVFIAEFYQCYDDYDDCMTDELVAGNLSIEQYRRYHRSRGQMYWDDDDISKSGNQYVDQCEDKLEECDQTVFGLFVGMVAFYVAASIPLYMMCCCSNPPPHQEGQFGVQQLPIQALTARVTKFMSFNKRPRNDTDNQQGVEFQPVSNGQKVQGTQKIDEQVAVGVVAVD